jgi:hypothetical protein
MEKPRDGAQGLANSALATARRTEDKEGLEFFWDLDHAATPEG